MNKICLVSLVFLLLASSCQKQSISKSSVSKEKQNPSSLNPEDGNSYSRRSYAPQETWFFGLFKKKKKLSWGDQLIAEYEERMKQNAKEKKKKAKEMEKPQYSDWTYFGHKKKPKIRPPEKMKYCEECGIRH